MAGRTHVVGAGVAGLAAALAVTRAGGAAVLYEAAPQAGGRCRTIRSPGGFAHDNGTHILFTANRRALGLLDDVGARHGWIEPEPDGVPIYDAMNDRLARVGLSPWSWLKPELRPDGMTLREFGRFARLALPFGERPLASRVRGSATRRNLVEPLAVAILNTPIETASSRRFGMALRRLARPGAARLLVARSGLSEDLIEPALATLRARGAVLRTGRRLKAVVRQDRSGTRLVFGDGTVPIAPEDQVILALPPSEIARLLPGLAVPEGYEPILNVHFRHPGPRLPRFVGLLGTTAQWALVRSDHVSVTVSAASRAIEEPEDGLTALIWSEVAPALAALGIGADRQRPPQARLVKERRATIRQSAGPLAQPPLRPLRNVALAGDWLGTLPATIESAVLAGERAALSGGGRIRRSLSRSVARVGAKVSS